MVVRLMVVVFGQKSPFVAEFGGVVRILRPNAFTVARCCLKSISKFAKPVVAEAGMDISSLLSVSIGSELLLAFNSPHSRIFLWKTRRAEINATKTTTTTTTTTTMKKYVCAVLKIA